MARGPCTFRQGDVTRALRAAMAAGMAVGSFEIDREGKITIRGSAGTAAAATANAAGGTGEAAGTGGNEWDDEA